MFFTRSENMDVKKSGYLKLRRRQGQSVVIGDHPNQVTVTIGETTRNGEITLQFFAPETIPIDRIEIARKKGRVVSTEL